MQASSVTCMGFLITPDIRFLSTISCAKWQAFDVHSSALCGLGRRVRSEAQVEVHEMYAMYAIGVMPMPAGFKYREVFLKGKPRHDRYDSFRIRHPKMPPGKRAKLFAPFDALRGFDFAILMKNKLYTDKADLSQEDQEELDRRCSILRSLTWNSRMARANQVQVAVTYYEACGVSSNRPYTDEKWGWTTLRNARVIRVRDGYTLELPRPEPL